MTKRYPMLDVEFVQLTQDMIGDLTSVPEPIAIKLFAQDPALLKQWAPQVADAITKIRGVVDVLNGIDNTISGPATLFKVDQAMAALCAEAVGAMGAMHALTVDYLKVRKQFGVPIGNFQVLQHRAADMFVAVEQARSMSMFATMAADFDDAKARASAVAAAKVQIGKSAKFVGQQAIQLHGGIGMTMEAKIGHYFKRLTMIDVMFGDADYHLARLAEAGGLIAA